MPPAVNKKQAPAIKKKTEGVVSNKIVFQSGSFQTKIFSDKNRFRQNVFHTNVFQTNVVSDKGRFRQRVVSDKCRFNQKENLTTNIFRQNCFQTTVV